MICSVDKIQIAIFFGAYEDIYVLLEAGDL